MRVGLAGVCWLIALALVALEVLRLGGWDVRSTYLIALSTAWPLVVIPGLLVVIGAAVLRHRMLGVAAVLMLFIVAPAWWPSWTGAAGSGPTNGLRVRVLALNVEYSQDTGAAASRQIQANDPDVVVVAELSALTLRHLDLRQYRYKWERPQSGAFGQGIYSRWPLTDVTIWTVADLSMGELTVATPNGPVRLFQVHTNAPRGGVSTKVWSAQLKELHSRMNAEKLPVIAAGDFNASQWDASFTDVLGGPRQMLDTGAGHGYLATWPSGRRWLPPVLPLDHVLVSKGVGARHFRVLGPVGSDHRGVVVDLTLPPLPS